MNIGIFGCSADPFHLGHMGIANKASYFYDRVCVVPCFVSRYGKNMLDFDSRLKIANITVRNNRENNNIFVESTERYYPVDGKSLNLINTMKTIYGADDATLIIGDDSLDNIKNWYGWGEGLEKENFLVINRLDKKFPEFEAMNNFKFMDIDPLYKYASSTGVRSDFNGIGYEECLFMDLEAARLCKANNFYLVK